jgi:hypothetical protein
VSRSVLAQPEEWKGVAEGWREIKVSQWGIWVGSIILISIGKYFLRERLNARKAGKDHRQDNDCEREFLKEREMNKCGKGGKG